MQYSKPSDSNSMLLYSTSTAKMAVPIGERKIAESPAAIPIITIKRRSRSGRLNQSA